MTKKQPRTQPERVLVVGGTGMLTGVVKALSHDRTVYVIARNQERLARKNPTRVHPLALDYRDTPSLERALTVAGPFNLAVVWVHRTAPDVPYVIARYVRGPYYHVLGSAAADPSRPDPERRARFRALETDYREVILGFVLEGGQSRWLTHAEIAAGVLEAIRQGKRRHVVGVVRPWGLRP